MKKKNCVLVTGGAGYIGSVTTKLLLEDNNRVIVIDNLSSGQKKAIPNGAQFIKGDVGDKKLLAKIFNKYNFDCVIHFAALIRIEESTQNPKKYFDNNVLAGFNLLQTMIEHKKCKKIIYSSSAAVYGVPTKIPITEDFLMQPINPYGQTKKLFEIILQQYADAGLINAIALRYFNVAGAYLTKNRAWGENHQPESHLIPLILQSVNSKRTFTIYGNDYPTRDGTCIRDYIHVYDLAQAHILAMQKHIQGYVVYNVGAGKGYSNYEVFQTTQKVTSMKIPFVIGNRRAGDCSILTASNKKIKSALNFNPVKSDLFTIIKDAWQYEKLRG
ncbi:MAG: UDP-glucose 4-epimerase GalE [Candidatus Latescibacteria bacterium]|nr:UDP-glucose 4-epimerase GalE [Candidatus Latescibacterota bacterium]